MKQYDINAIMKDIHQEYPVAGRRPVIGITGNYGELTCKLGEGYYKQIVAAGGTPVIIPPVDDKAVLMNILDRIDALVLSGGADINPLYAGEEPCPQLGGINSERDLPVSVVAFRLWRWPWGERWPKTSRPISNILRMLTALNLPIPSRSPPIPPYIIYIAILHSPST